MIALLHAINRGFALLVVGLIVVYQKLISPMLGSHCRFYPTCSEYSRQAFSTYGCIRGLWLTICRFGRCHPFSEGGFDLLPRDSHVKRAVAGSGSCETDSSGSAEMKVTS